MRQPEPYPIELRRAAWDRLWKRLLAEPAVAAEQPGEPAPTRDKGAAAA